MMISLLLRFYEVMQEALFVHLALYSFGSFYRSLPTSQYGPQRMCI